jgi:hypothetical protein
MDVNPQEVKQIASQILAGMLANPHIYPKVSDEGSQGQQEQELIIVAVELAKKLLEKVENTN